jgi:succinate-semialdehyde dehydrogenase/glutarate-semialdehyde dehydrogenase
VIFGIAPWNFPFNQLLRAAVPNIIAGNTVVYKHASNVPLCLQAIEQLFLDAGFPSGVFTKLFVTSSQSEMIIAHDAIQGVNITGSDFACSDIGSLASKYLKPSVTEGGGNDAFLLLDHKDMDDMAAKAANARCSF